MEAQIPGAGGRSQGVKDIPYQRLAKCHQRGSLVVLFVPRLIIETLTINRAEVLQGVRVMEGSSTSERVAAPRSDNDQD